MRRDENDNDENDNDENDNDDNDNDENDNDENDEDDEDDKSITELINRIENHTMKFDFILVDICTMQTIMNALDTNSTKCEGMYVIKYDGFPFDPNITDCP